MVLLGELDELALAHIVAKPKPLLAHARADLDKEDMVVRHLHIETQQLNLLERIALLEREEWTPDVCHICGKVNPKHSNLECPLYKQCDCCNGTGAYGYHKSHTCYGQQDDKENYNTEHNKCDYDLYWSGKD